MSLVNKEVAQFIRAFSHCQLVNSFYHEAQQLLQTIESDTPFVLVFLDFWGPGDTLYQDGSCKILTCLDCIIGFGVEAATVMKKITSDQAVQWAFGNLFVPFGIPKKIVMDADGLFDGNFKKTFQDTLIIPVHEVARGKHKSIRNEGFHWYLNKL